MTPLCCLQCGEAGISCDGENWFCECGWNEPVAKVDEVRPCSDSERIDMKKTVFLVVVCCVLWMGQHANAQCPGGRCGVPSFAPMSQYAPVYQPVQQVSYQWIESRFEDGWLVLLDNGQHVGSYCVTTQRYFPLLGRRWGEPVMTVPYSVPNVVGRTVVRSRGVIR